MSRQSARQRTLAEQVKPFLQDIQASPDDDAPRLIFADWLEEHGEPARAELIRVKSQLDRLPQGSGERRALEQRKTALVSEHREEWLGPWARLSPEVELVGGFPIKMTIRYGTASLDVLADGVSPYLDALQTLVFSWSTLPDGVVGCLAEDPPPSLRRLECHACRRGNAIVKALARWPADTALTALVLRGCDVGPVGLKPLLGVSWLERLRVLDLSANRLGMNGARALVQCRGLANLEELHLNQTGLGAEGAGLLASCPLLGKLTTLSLAWNALGDSGAEALARSPHLARLTTLHLGHNEIGVGGLRAILQSPSLKALRALHLPESRVNIELREAFSDRGITLSLGSD